MARTITLLACLVFAMAPLVVAASTPSDPITANIAGASTNPTHAAATGANTLVATSVAPAKSLLPAAHAAAAPGPSVPEVAGAVDAVQSAAQPVVDLLTCRQAVQLDLVWYGAKATDRRSGSGEFLAPYAFVDTVTRQVPIVQTTTETVWSAAGGLLGLLEPVTRTVTKVTGYETKTVTQAHSVDLAVAVDYNEDYLTWATYQDTVLVNLPVGLPFVLDGTGVQTTVCDPDALILDYVPDPDATQVDYVCTACSEQPADGWMLRILSLQARLANAGDYATLDWGCGFIVAPGDLLAQVRAKADGMGITAADDLLQDQQRLQANLPADAPAEPMAPQTGTVTHVPASTAAVVGSAFALGAAALAACGLALWRRLH